MHKKSIEAAMKIKEQESTGMMRMSDDDDESGDNASTTTTTTTNNLKKTIDNSRLSVDCIITSSSSSNRKDLRTESIAALRARAQCYNTESRISDRQRRTSGESVKSGGSDVTDRFESCFEIPNADRKKNGRDVIELDDDVI